MFKFFKDHYWYYRESTKHRLCVFYYLFKICCKLMWRGITHDLSKYRRIESKFAIPVMYKFRDTPYGPEYYKLLESVKPAVEFHYRQCRHHPEHYPNGYKGMSFIDRVEMIADWKAATKRSNNGNVIASIEKNKERFQYQDCDKEWFIKIVKDIG